MSEKESIIEEAKINLNIMDIINPKKIRQIQLKFNQSFPPYNFLNPYQLMAELNKLVKQKYDIEIVHMKYLETKNSEQKYLDSHVPPPETLEVNFSYNNVFSDQSEPEATEFLNVLFEKSEKLVPPTGYNPEEFEKNTESEMREAEMIKFNSLNEKIGYLMKVYNKKADENDATNFMAIDTFLILSHFDTYKNSVYEIYCKAIMNQAVFDKMKVDSKEKTSGLEIKYQGKSIFVYLNPTTEEEAIEKIHPEYFVNNWSLNVLHDNIFCSYFGTTDLEEKARKINTSIQLKSSISFNEVNSNVESFGIMTYFWSETVMKTVIKMSQIKKIEKAVVGKTHHYYFHLTYPPKYYLNEMKNDEANAPKYMKFFDRVINFIFLKNLGIKDNYFLRYYLFNNSIFRISVDLEDNKRTRTREGYQPADETYEKLEKLCKTFEGTIEYFDRGNKAYESKYSLNFLEKLLDYNNFIQNKKKHLAQHIQDKFWIIKYLILVMVRFNHINPTDKEINSIMGCIEDDKNIEYLDCYLYVLWRTATNMWGYDDKKKKFSEFFREECEDVKKMNVKNLIKRMLEESESIVYIFRVSLTPSGYLFNPPTPEMKGRLLKEYVKHSEFFMRLSFSEESEIELKNQKFITKMYFRKYLDELIILDRSYKPLGWSPSQLRSFSLWYIHETKERLKDNNEKLPQLERWRVLQFLGDFKGIPNHAKKAARIGQSFSSSWTYNGSNINSEIIEDVWSSSLLNFTDGIGKISEDLLEKISNKLNIRDLSVIQIRYKGAKGVLVLDPELGKNEIKLRPSMVKFECHDKRTDLYLDILDWNKYKSGLLNRQVIILLRTLEIQDEVFIRLQQEHISNISKMTFKDCSIFKHMNEDLNSDINNLEPANKTILNLLNAGFELEKEPFFRGVLETLKRNGYYQLKMKSNICVEKSARLIGIIDEDGILEEDEVYCSIYDHFAEIESKINKNNKKDKQVREVINSKAIITRNPCLDPADIRIVRCIGEVEIQERFDKLGKENNKFPQLQNVVIMPMKGKYPLTSQISGSDLDGDNFFVCWDDRLIPKAAYIANIIDEPITNKKDEKPAESLNEEEEYKKMLDFFIEYTNYEKLGQIDNSHLVHADKDNINFANNEKCRRLAKIHGKAVDFPKTGYCPPIDPSLFCSEYPDFMEKENGKTYVSTSILGRLYQDIKEQIQSLLEDKVYVGVTEIDKCLIHEYKFDQTKEEVKNCLKELKQFEREMTNLMTLIGVDTEYEVYSGNFSTVKDKVKSFGKNRLIATILSIRDRFFEFFFKDLFDDEERYKETGYDEKHMKKPKYFSSEASRKCQLYYLVSYIRKFPEIEENKLEEFQELKKCIEECLEELQIGDKSSKYCGYVWFILPKIMLNLKITFNASIFEKEKEENDEENSGPEEDDEFI